MKKVNLFEELINERSKQITSEELKSALKNIWSKDDQIKESLDKKKLIKPGPAISTFIISLSISY